MKTLTHAAFLEWAERAGLGPRSSVSPLGGAGVPAGPAARPLLGTQRAVVSIYARGNPNELMIAVLYSHPQVYVDIAGNDWSAPRPHFYGQLKRLVDAGFIKRIMWGSDQMIWPQTIGVAIETIQTAPFLTEEQKRDIFYNNAARFLRLSDADIAKHHRR
jgi:hypothetical protein